MSQDSESSNEEPTQPADFEPLRDKPFAPGEVDPALASLRVGRRPLDPWVVISFLVLCMFFLWKLFPAMQYAGQGETPVALNGCGEGGVSGTFAQFVGELDWANSVRVARNRAAAGKRVVPVRGCETQLWVVLDGEGTELGKSFQGRLERARALSWHSGVSALLTAEGRVLTPNNEGEVELKYLDPNSSEVFVRRVEPFVKKENWADYFKALAVPVEFVGEEPGGWVFSSSISKETLVAKVIASGRDDVQVRLRPVTKIIPAGEFQTTEAGVQLPGNEIPWERVVWFATENKAGVSPDALILDTTEHPGSFTNQRMFFWVIVVLSVLVLVWFIRNR